MNTAGGWWRNIAITLIGAVLGGIGGVIGAFAGYQALTRLVKGLKAKDVFIAIPEDLVAIGFGYFLVFAR